MCVQQLVELQRGYARIKALGAEVLVIGVDPARAWDGSVKQHKLTVPILTDADRAVSRAYGTLNLPSVMHPGERPGHTFFVADRDGVIRWKKDVADMGLVPTAVVAAELQRLRGKGKGK